MQRIAFTMQLHPGFEEEYQRRHSVIWPELRALLHDKGVKEYSIFLDEPTLRLFAYFQVDDAAKLQELPAEEVMQRWWDYMKDIMDTNPDHSPVTKPLKEVFYMP
jgi:L-rhamnose mutarotase